MQDTVKRKIELEKKQLSLKNMYFNRYLIVRYLTAFFFFMNMQWMILLLSAKSLGSSVFIQYRLKKISLNQDQQYIRIKQYEKALYLGKENN